MHSEITQTAQSIEPRPVSAALVASCLDLDDDPPEHDRSLVNSPRGEARR